MSKVNDDKLLETLEKFRGAIPVRELYEFSTTALDRLGIPLYCVAAWTDANVYYDGFGYGAGENGAKIGAWGEIMESYFADDFMRSAPRTKASYNELKAAQRNAVEPPKLCLNAGCDYAPDREIVWLEINNLSGAGDGKTLVPLESVAVYPAHAAEIAADKLLFRPITNGLGAGASLAQAVAHGALEIVQRDGNCVTFRAMDIGQQIELDVVKSAETRELLALFDAENIEIIAKLAGIVADIPVIYVVGYDRDLSRAEFSMQISACGEAAHPDREIALNKALREYVSGRARKHFMHGTLDKLARVAPAEYVRKMSAEDVGAQETRALEAVIEWATATNEEVFAKIERPILETRSTIKFSDLPTNEFAEGDWEAILAHLQIKFAALGTEILYADFSANAPEGIFVARAVVPGMEGETMSYGRIGRRNLERLLERQRTDERIGKLVGFGADEKPAFAVPIHLCEADADDFPGAWLDPQAVAAQVGEFYALYREPESFAVGRALRERER
ncbi:MAG: YcaO-like family protein [Acidobacteriota bacterium]|nr:YcaO-like family protein [Acidobacteriota bacterium]